MNYLLNPVFRTFTGTVAMLLVAMPLYVTVPQARAAVSDWQKAATIVPESTTDFAGEGFKETLRNLKATGANYVGLVVPYYQANIGTSDIQNGWNTPTDASLIAAIDYAHSIGLGVTLKPHVEVYDGTWRAQINPGDRAAWFANYRGRLVSLGTIAREHGVEMITIGTEMVSLAAHNMHPTNTENWVNIIGALRAVYSGKLTYGANSTSNNDNVFQNEKRYIAFWSQLDYAGLSVYYGLNSDNSVAGLKGAWDYWNNNDIRGFAQSVGKPVLFLEIGYRSIDNAHQDPWNWQRGGSYNEAEQANNYEALMSYWNDYPYVAGVYWWDWDVNPAAGGSGNIDYTPQHKQAQTVLTQWFTNPPQGNQTPQTPAFESTGSPNPGGTTVGNTVTLDASIHSLTQAPVSGGIVDIEVYNSENQKVFQQFYEGQNFGSGETRAFAPLWAPAASGTYRMKIGVFSGGWANVYHWNDAAGAITVSGDGGGGTPPAEEEPPSSSAATNIWWPAEGAQMYGTQPLKADIPGRDVSTYRMFWQVDGDRLNEMYDSAEDYPHKEAWVDFSGWRWRGTGPYTLMFVSQDFSGSTISSKSVNIYVP